MNLSLVAYRLDGSIAWQHPIHTEADAEREVRQHEEKGGFFNNYLYLQVEDDHGTMYLRVYVRTVGENYVPAWALGGEAQ
jgi:hypothetical protein